MSGVSCCAGVSVSVWARARGLVVLPGCVVIAWVAGVYGVAGIAGGSGIAGCRLWCVVGLDVSVWVHAHVVRAFWACCGDG